MSRLNMKMLMGASALVAFAAFGAAQAAPVQGGGSSLIGPYQRGASDCYGDPQPLYISGGSPQTIAPFNFTGTPPFDCSTTHVAPGRVINYVSAGSGAGRKAFVAHDPTYLGDIDPTTPGVQTLDTENYSMSDAAVSSADVAIYTNGGVTADGIHVAAHNTPPGPGEVTNPFDAYGPMIQIPVAIAPVDIAYDPVYFKFKNASGYVKIYKFNVQHNQTAVINGVTTVVGGLRLDAPTYCKIFNGQITNWNDPALTALNDGVSLRAPTDTRPFDVPIVLVGRSDGSGTTSIFTRHLGAACATLAGNVYGNPGTTTLPASLRGQVYDKTKANDDPTALSGTPGLIILAPGNDGVAKYVDFSAVPTASGIENGVTWGRMGYIGNDFALPASRVTLAGTSLDGIDLYSANLLNNEPVPKFVPPTPLTARNAFGLNLPPQSNADGTFNASVTENGLRADPNAWVQGLDTSSPLAWPTSSSSYPIVGTTNILAYSCYANVAGGRATPLRGYLGWYFTSSTVSDKTQGLLANSGLSAMPLPWRTAYVETYLNQGGAAASLGLRINNANTTGVCAARTGLVGG